MLDQHTEVKDSRFLALLQWFDKQKTKIAHKLNQEELAQGQFTSASSDASFRRYFRWHAGAQSLILMDAPPTHENSLPFVQISQLLLSAGLHAPVVLAHDLEQGFLVLTDLGTQNWLEYWQADASHLEQADALFTQALQTLLQMQKIDTNALSLPSYDEALLRRELELFPQWYVAHELGLTFNAQQQQWWDSVTERLIESALAQEMVFVHRDFMPRNLMCSQPNPALIDFQDAVIGPISYDVISLFKDAFISWPEDKVSRWLEQYWANAKKQGIAVPKDFKQFRQDCDLMGLQRHLKVIGIFARIYHRDGKPRYLADVPRFFNYIEPLIERYPELAELGYLLDSLPIQGRDQ